MSLFAFFPTHRFLAPWPALGGPAGLLGHARTWPLQRSHVDAVGVHEVVLDEAAGEEGHHDEEPAGPRHRSAVRQAHGGGARQHGAVVLIVPRGVDDELLHAPQSLQHTDACQSTAARLPQRHHGGPVDGPTPCTCGSPAHRDQQSRPDIANVVLGLQRWRVPLQPLLHRHATRAVLADEARAPAEQVRGLAAEEVGAYREEGVRLRLKARKLDVVHHIRRRHSRAAVARAPQEVQQQQRSQLLPLWVVRPRRAPRGD
mmetsp:Transcript_73561/g.206547  ORF Transcript_73561/g.206547 Transcript_73561/m.206547 type:complete len:258 (+) Transcript_73561:14-787(+)